MGWSSRCKCWNITTCVKCLRKLLRNNNLRKFVVEKKEEKGCFEKKLKIFDSGKYGVKRVF